MSELSLQRRYSPDSRCFGCGPANEYGLRIESHEVAGTAGELRADWQPLPHHAAFDNILNGGVIGTLLDCHANWAAAMHLMHARGLAGPPGCVTADYTIRLRRPTPVDRPVQLRAWPVDTTGEVARWDEVVRVLTPAALQGQELGSVSDGVGRMPMRWLMAEAYDQLGRPDSAAAYLELVLSPARMSSEKRTLLGIPYSFAHQRLVLLYARMGRLTDAQRHWKIFSGDC